MADGPRSQGAQAGWELLIAPAFAGDVAHYSEPDGEGGIHIHSVQDVAPILERNKRVMNDCGDGYNAERDRRRVATIPAIVRQYFLDMHGWDPWRPDIYPDEMAKLLNDPDWAFLRTAPGRVASVNGKLR